MIQLRHATVTPVDLSSPAYVECVYAGVLGKLIGIAFGLPVEGWGHADVVRRFGEVTGYVAPLVGKPIVATSDDVTGMFAFPRALIDSGAYGATTARQFGEAWLNYYCEQRSGFWWGGFGVSSEHTAYVRLRDGIRAPESGSIARNGRLVAEQIGGRIFSDSFAMLHPGDPRRAADLAEQAARVSHDGEAIHGGRMIVAMEALAFVERDLDRLIDAGLEVIPADCLIRRVSDDVRAWWRADQDWRAVRERIAATWGYDRFGGSCHIVPNHALVMLGLLAGGGDLRHSLMITATSGWDADCNCSAVGCLLGIRDGIAGIDTCPDLRAGLGDRLYLSTVDGARAVTDAATEALHLVDLARAIADAPRAWPKDGARFAFALRGSTQGWTGQPAQGVWVQAAHETTPAGQTALAVRFTGVGPGRPARVAGATFVPPDTLAAMNGPDQAPNRPAYQYHLMASPTLYPGQTVRLRVIADPGQRRTLTCRPWLRCYGGDDRLAEPIEGPASELAPGATIDLVWRIPEVAGQPIAEIGLRIDADADCEGVVWIDHVTWDGIPDCDLLPAQQHGSLWRKAWADCCDQVHAWGSLALAHAGVRGCLITGERRWRDYRLRARLAIRMGEEVGIAVRVQGLRRYVAVLVGGGTARLVAVVDGIETVLAQAPWTANGEIDADLAADGVLFTARIAGVELSASDDRLIEGAVALMLTRANVSVARVRVEPL